VAPTTATWGLVSGRLAFISFSIAPKDKGPEPFPAGPRDFVCRFVQRATDPNAPAGVFFVVLRVIVIGMRAT
jgi:hypothetical protein